MTYHTETMSYGVYDAKQVVYFDFDLGREARDRNPDNRYYWEEVRKLLLRPLIRVSYKYPTKILLVGDAVNDEEFRTTLQQVLVAFFNDTVPPIMDADPEYVQARGVADLVRRRRYLPEPRKPEDSMYFGVEHAGKNCQQKNFMKPGMKGADMDKDQIEL